MFQLYHLPIEQYTNHFCRKKESTQHAKDCIIFLDFLGYS